MRVDRDSLLHGCHLAEVAHYPVQLVARELVARIQQHRHRRLPVLDAHAQHHVDCMCCITIGLCCMAATCSPLKVSLPAPVSVHSIAMRGRCMRRTNLAGSTHQTHLLSALPQGKMLHSPCQTWVRLTKNLRGLLIG